MTEINQSTWTDRISGNTKLTARTLAETREPATMLMHSPKDMRLKNKPQ